MKKLKYFDGCELEYMITLGLWNKTSRRYTSEYWSINKAWNKLRDDKKLFFLPKIISKILIAKYTKLVVYFKYFDNFIEKNVPRNSYQSKRSYAKARKIFLAPFTNIFNYSVSSKNRLSEYKDISCYDTKIAVFFKKYAEKLDITSCFYCESAYTGVYSDKGKIKRTFDIDHFFQKEQYPIFALSLYNFVPCCQVCNSRVKGSGNFKNLYNLGSRITNKDIYFLLRISPTSPYYQFYENTKIGIYPALSESNKIWQYNDDLDMYKIQFDCDKNGPYQKVIDALQLDGRYNSISIKAHAKYLENIKKKYTDEYILEIATFLTKAGWMTTEKQIKEVIFHLDERYILLKKMHKDLLM